MSGAEPFTAAEERRAADLLLTYMDEEYARFDDLLYHAALELDLQSVIHALACIAGAVISASGLVEMVRSVDEVIEMHAAEEVAREGRPDGRQGIV